MMHTNKELYKINGEKFYTADYIVANNIPKATKQDKSGWSHCMYLGTDKGTKNIHTANGVRVVYTYGEKTWFDTEEERDAYRAEQNKARAEQTKKNALLKEIKEYYEEMNIDQLEKALAMLKR